MSSDSSRHANLEILGTELVSDFVLRIGFSDGVVKDVDFWPLLTGPQHRELRDMDHFIQYGLMPWGNLEWYNGVDFDPEYLYEHGVVTGNRLR